MPLNVPANRVVVRSMPVPMNLAVWRWWSVWPTACRVVATHPPVLTSAQPPPGQPPLSAPLRRTCSSAATPTTASGSFVTRRVYVRRGSNRVQIRTIPRPVRHQMIRRRRVRNDDNSRCTTCVQRALVWVTADGLRKHITSQFDAVELGVCLHGLQVPFLAVLLTVPWVLPNSEWSATAFSLEFKSGYWLPAIPTRLCNAVANVLFLRALQLSDLSLSIPYLSLTPVFAMLTGWLVVGEVPTTLGLTGVMMIGFGALVESGKSSTGRFQPIQTLLDEKEARVLGVAALWASPLHLIRRPYIRVHRSPTP